MQTVHSSKKSIHDHSAAVVDLQEYRRGLEAVDGSLALAPPSEAAPRRPARASRTRARARRRWTLSDWLDAVATLILIAVVITVWVQLMS